MEHNNNWLFGVISLSVCLVMCELEDQEKNHLLDKRRNVLSLTVAMVQDNRNDVRNAAHSARTRAHTEGGNILDINHRTKSKSLGLLKNLKVNHLVRRDVLASSKPQLDMENNDSANIFYTKKSEAGDLSDFTRRETVGITDISTTPEISPDVTVESVASSSGSSGSLSNLNQDNADFKRGEPKGSKAETGLGLPNYSTVSEPKQIIATTVQSITTILNHIGDNSDRINNTKNIDDSNSNNNKAVIQIRQLAEDEEPQETEGESLLNKDKQSPSLVTTELSGVKLEPKTSSGMSHGKNSVVKSASQKIVPKHTSSTQFSSTTGMDVEGITSVTGSEVEELQDREAVDRRCNQPGNCLRANSRSNTSDAYWAAASLLTVLLLLTVAVIYTGLLKRRNTFESFVFTHSDGDAVFDDLKSTLNIKVLLKKIPRMSRMSHHGKRSRNQWSKHFQGNKYRRLPILAADDGDDFLEEDITQDDYV